MKKFSYNIGNPPYGKNSSTALKFLNLGAKLADNVLFVVPRTFRKPSLINRVESHLHLISDNTVDDEAFRDSIITCKQHWKVCDNERPHIETLNTHTDFEFTTADMADFAVGRVGGGPAAKVFHNPKERSASSHYFVKALTEGVVESFVELYPILRESAMDTVGCPSLSKHDIITIYQNGRK